MATEYGWDELVFDGDPLASWLQGFLSSTSDVLDFMAGILELQAAALRLLADIVSLFETPLDSLIFEVFLELLNLLLAMLHGRFSALFIAPLNYQDKFGPEGFVERVNVTYDDVGDPQRPIIDDFDGNSTIQGTGGTLAAPGGIVDVDDWRGFVDGVYTTVSAGSVDLSTLPNGFYIITVEDGAFTSKSLSLVDGAPQSDFSASPAPITEMTEYVLEVTEFIIELGNRFNAARYSTIGDVVVEFPQIAFAYVSSGEITSLLDARQYTPTVAMLVMYFNDANIGTLAQKIAGLGLFFKQSIDQFTSLADAIENYVPREVDSSVESRRRAGRPPDWWTPAISFFVELENVLRQFMVQVSPPPGNAEYLELVAEFLEEQALFLRALAVRLESIADLLEMAVFTAARFWTPLSYGGTNFLKNLLTATVPQLTNQLEADADDEFVVSEFESSFYSVGVVLVGDAISVPIMAMIGGVDLTGGTGVLPDTEPNIVTIEGNTVTVVSP